jgi:hypothetical protein
MDSWHSAVYAFEPERSILITKKIKIKYLKIAQSIILKTAPEQTHINLVIAMVYFEYKTFDDKCDHGKLPSR